jgi:hypothetical protein
LHETTTTQTVTKAIVLAGNLEHGALIGVRVGVQEKYRNIPAVEINFFIIGSMRRALQLRCDGAVAPVKTVFPASMMVRLVSWFTSA